MHKDLLRFVGPRINDKGEQAEWAEAERRKAVRQVVAVISTDYTFQRTRKAEEQQERSVSFAAALNHINHPPQPASGNYAIHL